MIRPFELEQAGTAACESVDKWTQCLDDPL